VDTVIASGDDPSVIWKLLAGEAAGTLFRSRRS
jgi:glutamate 5-kinase